MPAPTQSLRARALQWLAQREHSRIELRRKLLRWARQRADDEASAGASDGEGHAGDAAEVDALLDWLEANRHLSDARFVESRVNARAARHGNVRIRRELGQHGAALDAATAERLKSNELQRAGAVWARKYGGRPALEASERARQMRFLAGRGFTADVIRRVVQGAALESDDPA